MIYHQRISGSQEAGLTIFDLVFLVLVLATVVDMVAALILLLRGRFRSAGRWALMGAAVWVVYLGVGLIVAVASPQRVLTGREERCFDEMCFGVTGVERDAAGRLAVTVSTNNRGRGRAQREGGAEAFLLDSAGRRYEPVEASGPGPDAAVAAGESVSTRLVFAVPAEARGLGLVVDHSYWLYPGRIIVGDEDHLGHRPTVIVLGQ
jgi:hypothetical protein